MSASPGLKGTRELASERMHHEWRRIERDAPGCAAAIRAGKAYAIVVPGTARLFPGTCATAQGLAVRLLSVSTDMYASIRLPITSIRVRDLRAFLDAHDARDIALVVFDQDTRAYPIDAIVAHAAAHANDGA